MQASACVAPHVWQQSGSHISDESEDSPVSANKNAELLINLQSSGHPTCMPRGWLFPSKTCFASHGLTANPLATHVLLPSSIHGWSLVRTTLFTSKSSRDAFVYERVTGCVCVWVWGACENIWDANIMNSSLEI
jgi:hypothetical protein